MIIPMEIILENAEFEHTKNCVLDKWENDFANLFSGNNIASVFDDFLNDTCNLTNWMGIKMNRAGYT